MWTQLKGVFRMPAGRIHFVFGLVLAGSACMALVQLRYLVSTNTRPADTVMRVTPKQQDESMPNDATLPKIPRDKWIIIDVTPALCKGQKLGLTPPPGWNVLRASQAHINNSVLQLEKLPAYVNHVRYIQTNAEQVLAKNDAYISAMAQGAVQIVEADCSVPSEEALELMKLQTSQDHGLMYNKTLLFNPYAHFGAWALVPKAAVVYLRPWNNSQLYYVRDLGKVLIKRAVADRSPDAVFSPGTRHSNRAGVTFEASTPPVYVGQRSFSPAVPVCSGYHRQAFWALLDPCLSSDLRCRVLRLLLQQRLLRELDAFSGYYQLSKPFLQFSVSLQRVDKHHSGDTTLASVVAFLDEWKCDEEFQFYWCFQSLGDQLFNKGYINQHQNKMVTQFIATLRTLDITEPTRVKTPWRGVRKIGEFKVKLSSLNNTLESEGTVKEDSLNSRLVEPVVKRCKGFYFANNPIPIKQWRTPVIEDVVLIIVFNKNSYVWKNLPYLETMHRPYFKHIAYCVTDLDSLLSEDSTGVLNHITVVEGLTDYWFLMYGCTTMLMQMKIPGVRGYLQIGDDTLLNAWVLFNSTRDAMFWPMINDLKLIDAHLFKTRPRWKWWHFPVGRCSLLDIMAGLERGSGLTKQQLLAWAGTSADVAYDQRMHTFSEIVEGDKARRRPVIWCDTLPGTEVWAKPSKKQARRFLYNYHHTHNMSGQFYGQCQDFAYTPQTLAEDFVTMSHLFMRHRVIVELALNAIQQGIAGPRELQKVHGSSLWGQDRSSPSHFFNETHFFIHPFKYFAYTFNKPREQDFYCDVYLRTLVSKLKRVRPWS